MYDEYFLILQFSITKKVFNMNVIPGTLQNHSSLFKNKIWKKITRIILQIQLSAATLQGTLRVIKAMLQSSKYIVVSPTVLFSKFMKI